jgi:Right handed beta helix region
MAQKSERIVVGPLARDSTRREAMWHRHSCLCQSILLERAGQDERVCATHAAKERMKSLLSGRGVSALLLAGVAWPQTVHYADKFPGADAGEKISHCLAALPSQGGICDARELSGPQRASQGFTVGEPGKPVELMLGPVTLYVGGAIHVQRRSSILGMPAGAGIGNDQSASVIEAADNSALSAVVQVDGALAVLQDLTVDGNRKGAPKGGTAILVNQANRAEMFRVTAQNAPGYGIELYSTPRNESCCAKLQKVMSIANGQAGLHLASTADVFISLSEFENNGTFGIELNNSPTTRIEHSDMGGNALDGIRIYGTAGSPLQSHRQIIVGNQFGNNGRYDIAIAGFDDAGKKHVSTGNLISSNEFIGSPTRPAGYEAIHIADSGENTIVANTFSAPRGHPYSSCIGISGDREGQDQVSGNTCTATAAAKDAFTGTPTTVFGPNQGKGAPSPKTSPSPK